MINAMPTWPPPGVRAFRGPVRFVGPVAFTHAPRGAPRTTVGWVTFRVEGLVLLEAMSVELLSHDESALLLPALVPDVRGEIVALTKEAVDAISELVLRIPEVVRAVSARAREARP